jgi:hypothetical protein
MSISGSGDSGRKAAEGLRTGYGHMQNFIMATSNVEEGKKFMFQNPVSMPGLQINI